MPETTTQKQRPLTDKRLATVEYYCNPQSETFNNRTQSMIKAGYSPIFADKRAYVLWGNVGFIKAMADYKAKITNTVAITVEYIQSQHLRLADLAEHQRDLSTATANVVALGRTVAAYSDNINTTDLTKQAKLDEKADKEAAELARIRLGEKYGVKNVG